MNYPPTGSERLCECAARHRGSNSTAAFDEHRQGFRCLEPSSIGLWLATDDLWSLDPRNPEAETQARRARGLALAARRGQEAPRALGNAGEQPDPVLPEGYGPNSPQSRYTEAQTS